MAERRRRTMSAVVGAVVLFAVLLVLHHLRGTGAPHAAASQPVHFAVGIADCTFTDTTRATPDYLNSTEPKGRTLLTEIRYPTLSPKRGRTESSDVHPAVGHGPYPLVIFAHGYDLTPDSYSKLLDSWVRAGFVVAAPLFPDTNAHAVAQLPLNDSSIAENDDINQPGDVAFLTRQLVASDAPTSAGCAVLHKLLAPQKIALAGQSDGATTDVGLAYDPKFVKSTIAYRAVVDLSGQQFGAGTTTPDPLTGVSPPLLVSQSAADACNPPQFATAVYNEVAEKSKWFLELETVHHLPPYIGTNAPAFNEVVAVTTLFLKDEFAGVNPDNALLTLGNAHPAVSQLTTGATAPTIPALVQSPSACYLQS
jgi:hypothetical protein